MANDYMAKLAADLDGMTMMREPKPMPIIYRQEGGDFDAGSFGGVGFGGDVDDAAAAQGEAADYGGDIGGPTAAEQAAAEEEARSEAAYTGAQTAEEQQYNLPPGTLDLVTGVGTGGPGEFAGGISDPASTNAALRDILEKEGMTREQAVYFNALKERGLSNKDAIAALAAALGTPGGAAALSAGYTDGYSYGGPMGTLGDILEGGKDSIEALAAAKRKKEKEKKETEDDAFGESTSETPIYEGPGFMDRFASILGLDDFSLASLNPLSNKLTPNQQAIMQSYRDQGLMVQQRSPMDYALGFMGSAMLPTELGIGKFALERATDTNIIGLATDPATGFEYLVESGGGLQLAPGQLGDEPNQDGGNEPTITAKRKTATEKPKEEKKKEASKEGFPQQKLPRFTPSGQTTIANIYGSDSPILDKYTTGIQALV